MVSFFIEHSFKEKRISSHKAIQLDRKMTNFDTLPQQTNHPYLFTVISYFSFTLPGFTVFFLSPVGFLFLCDHRHQHHHHQYFYSSETNQIKIVVTNEKNAIMIIVIR